MDDYTPTTADVRSAYAQNYVRTVEYHEAGFLEFDRWLKEHDLEVAKNAYKRGYADGLETGTADWP